MASSQTVHLAYCPRCNKLFSNKEQPVCRSCVSAEEEDYRRVREALREGIASDAESLAEQADVSIGTVLRMFDQGMIASAEDLNVRCGRCGAPAIGAQQRLCPSCAVQLDRGISDAITASKLNMPASRKPLRVNQVHKYLTEKRRHG